MPRRFRAPKRSLVAAFLATPLLLPGPLGEARAQATTPDTGAAPADEPATAPARPRWQLAPIGWSGRLGLVASVLDNEGQARQTQLSEVANVGARTYIWQPWFIQVMGNLGLVLTQTRFSDEPTDSPNELRPRNSQARGVTGGLAVNVFPISRFPFQLNVDVADSRTGDAAIGSDYRSTRIGMRQDYRTVPGDTSYVATFDSSTLTSDRFGRDRVNVLDGEMNKLWEDHRLQVKANFADNSRSRDDLGSRTARLSAQHAWRPEELLSIDSLASIAREERRLLAGQSASTFDARQVSSSVNWRTDWDEPLNVFGTARLYDASESGDSGARTRQANLVGTVSYRFTPNLMTYGAASAAHLQSGEQTDTLTTQSVGAQYQFDPRSWGRVLYSANTSLSAGNQTGGDRGSRQLYQFGFGHQVNMPITIGQFSSWTFGLGQNGNLIQESDNGLTRSFSHTASTNWRYSPPSGLATYAGLSLSDVRTFGKVNEGQFQLANFQLSGQMQTSSYSSFNANLTAQWTRQSTLADPEPTVSRSVGGGASYQHARLFGVPRLRYLAQLNIYSQNTDRRIEGNPDAPVDPVSWQVEQRLDYTIGLLDCRLTVRVAEVDGKKNASVVASVYRRFGR